MSPGDMSLKNPSRTLAPLAPCGSMPLSYEPTNTSYPTTKIITNSLPMGPTSPLETLRIENLSNTILYLLSIEAIEKDNSVGAERKERKGSETQKRRLGGRRGCKSSKEVVSLTYGDGGSNGGITESKRIENEDSEKPGEKHRKLMMVFKG